MKNSINLFLSAMTLIQLSCQSSAPSIENQSIKNAETIAVADTVKPNKFANIHFASKYDTSCGMPLSAGLEDTLHYKGKIYGFCSKQCKDEFADKIKKINRNHE